MSGQEIQQKPEDSEQRSMVGGKNMIGNKQKGGASTADVLKGIVYFLLVAAVIAGIVCAYIFLIKPAAKKIKSGVEKVKTAAKNVKNVLGKESFIMYNPSDANHAKIHIDPETTYIETYIRSCLGTEK